MIYCKIYTCNGYLPKKGIEIQALWSGQMTTKYYELIFYGSYASYVRWHFEFVAIVHK